MTRACTGVTKHVSGSAASGELGDHTPWSQMVIKGTLAAVVLS